MELDLLDHQIQGDKESKVLIVFLQGWPDSRQMWHEKMDSKQNLKEFKQIYIDFPNYGEQKLKWGQDFETIAKRIKKTVDSVPNVQKKILVCHDWGCVFGYVLDQIYPKYFDFILALDVPAYTEISGGLKGKLFVVAYQSFLIWSFLIGGFIGEALTRSASKLFKHYLSYLDQIKADRNYPYYYYWKNQLLSRFGKQPRLLKGYTPSVPISYFFGQNKPMQFHGKRWIDYLKKSEGCSIQGLSAGHWFMGKYKMQLVKEIFRIAKL